VTYLLEVCQLQRPGCEPLDISLATGEALAVMGPSGAGKSRLLRAIAELDPNEAEAVSLAGADRSSFAAPAWRRQVTYVAATPGWWAPTVADHFKTEHLTDANALATRVSLPSNAFEWTVSRLSTGEAQRLALIRALVQKPKVLLLDEPTASLDDEATAKVEALLRQRMTDGASLVIVTHNKNQVARLAKHCLRMDRTGKVTVEKV